MLRIVRKALGQAGACPQLHSPKNNEEIYFWQE